MRQKKDIFKQKTQSLEDICLKKLVQLIEKPNKISLENNLNCNLAIKLFSILLRRGSLNDNLLKIILKSISQMETSNVNELDLIASISKITNTGLDILLKTFSPNLKVLILNSTQRLRYMTNNSIDTKSLFTIAKYCSNLLHLEIKNCLLVNDTGVIEICKRCKLLEKLNCAGCVNLSNLSLISASQLQNLKSLNLSQTHINDKGVQTFLKNIKTDNLQEAVFNSCKNLTKVSIESIFEKCEKLKRFSFNDCPNIDFEAWNFNRSCIKEIVWTHH